MRFLHLFTRKALKRVFFSLKTAIKSEKPSKLENY